MSGFTHEKPTMGKPLALLRALQEAENQRKMSKSESTDSLLALWGGEYSPRADNSMICDEFLERPASPIPGMPLGFEFFKPPANATRCLTEADLKGADLVHFMHENYTGSRTLTMTDCWEVFVAIPSAGIILLSQMMLSVSAPIREIQSVINQMVDDYATQKASSESASTTPSLVSVPFAEDFTASNGMKARFKDYAEPVEVDRDFAM